MCFKRFICIRTSYYCNRIKTKKKKTTADVFLFSQLRYYPCLRFKAGHGLWEATFWRATLESNNKRLSTVRVKRSISGKSPSKQQGTTVQHQIELAEKLRLKPKSVEAINAYFGLVQRRKPANGQADTHGTSEAKKIAQASNPSTKALKSKAQEQTETTSNQIDTEWALALDGVQMK